MAETFVFKSEGDKKESIIQALKQLKETIGWRTIVKTLEANIRDVEAKLFGEKEWVEGETLKVLQDKKRDREELMDMPDALIEEYQDKEAFPPELDPYF